MEAIERRSGLHDEETENDIDAQSSVQREASSKDEAIRPKEQGEADKRHWRAWQVQPSGTSVSSPPLSAGAAQIGEALFEQFCEADDLPEILGTFNQLCDVLNVVPSDIHTCFPVLRSRLRSWKARTLLGKLEKKASANVYRRGQVASGARVLVVGAGPCGLRTAIECALLGARTCVVEKRARFTRYNVVHIWPFIIEDLKALGAKSFYGRFAAGAIEHISIRRLQAILLKVALLLGVDVQPNVAFVDILDEQSEVSPAAQSGAPGETETGWRVICEPRSHPVNALTLDVLVGADGRRNTLRGFDRKEFRGRLAIAITCNFVNRHTREEASVPEISGVSRIFKPHFFQQLMDAVGIDLENIVYYKDDTHYFVMTAAKSSLLAKHVLKQDFAEAAELLAPSNVDRAALLAYAREAAEWSTAHALPPLEWARNQHGEEDVAMFDFTCLHKAVHASLVRVRRGRPLLMTLVGDSLCEPFWPIGSGIGRGFLGALDAAWMIRDWFAGHKSRLQVLAEREFVYQLLSQTSDDNLNKQHAHYTIQPRTRYPLLDLSAAKTETVAHLVLQAEANSPDSTIADAWLLPSQPSQTLSQPTQPQTQAQSRTANTAQRTSGLASPIPTRHDSNDVHMHVEPQQLLRWLQIRLQRYAHRFTLFDLRESWRSGLALCALVHLLRPDLLNPDTLDETNRRANLEQAFALSQQAFGFKPSCSVDEALAGSKLFADALVDFLERYFWVFKDERVKTPEMPLFAKRKSTSKPSILHGVAQKLGRSKVYSNDASTRLPPASDNVPCAPNCSIYDRPSTGIGMQTPSASAGAPESCLSQAGSKHKRSSATERDESAKNKVAGLAHLLFGSKEKDKDKDKDKKPKEKREEKTNGAPFARTRDLLFQLPLFRSSSRPSAAPMSSTPDAPTQPQVAAATDADSLATAQLHTPTQVTRTDHSSAATSISCASATTTTGTTSTHTPLATRTPRPLSAVLPASEPDRPKQLRRALLFGVSAAARQGRCIVCAERVYPAERLAADGYAFHRRCFRCFECDCPLRLSAYILLRDESLAPSFFCVPHGHAQARFRKTSASQPVGTPDACPFPASKLPSSDNGVTQSHNDADSSPALPARKMSADVHARLPINDADADTCAAENRRSSRTLTMRHDRPAALKRSSLIVPMRSFLNESDDERFHVTDDDDEDGDAAQANDDDNDEDDADYDRNDQTLRPSARTSEPVQADEQDDQDDQDDDDDDGDKNGHAPLTERRAPDTLLERPSVDDAPRLNGMPTREADPDADADSLCSSNTTSTSLYDPPSDDHADDDDAEENDNENDSGNDQQKHNHADNNQVDTDSCSKPDDDAAPRPPCFAAHTFVDRPCASLPVSVAATPATSSSLAMEAAAMSQTPTQVHTPTLAQTPVQLVASRVERVASASAKLAFLQNTSPLRIDPKCFFAKENLKKLTQGDASVSPHECVWFHSPLALPVISFASRDTGLLQVSHGALQHAVYLPVASQLSPLDCCSQPQVHFFVAPEPVAAAPVEPHAADCSKRPVAAPDSLQVDSQSLLKRTADLNSADDDYLEVEITDWVHSNDGADQPHANTAAARNANNAMMSSVYSAVSVARSMCSTDDQDADSESTGSDDPDDQSQRASPARPSVPVQMLLPPVAAHTGANSPGSNPSLGSGSGSGQPHILSPAAQQPPAANAAADVALLLANAAAAAGQLCTPPKAFDVDMKFIEDTCTEVEDHSDVEQRSRGGRTAAPTRKAVPPTSLNIGGSAPTASAGDSSGIGSASGKRPSAAIRLAPKATFSSGDSDDSDDTSSSSGAGRDTLRPSATAGRRGARRPPRKDAERPQTLEQLERLHTTQSPAREPEPCVAAQSTSTSASSATTPTTIASAVPTLCSSSRDSVSRDSTPTPTASMPPSLVQQAKRRPQGLLVGLFAPLDMAALKAKRSSAAYASDSEAPLATNAPFIEHSPVSTTMNTPSSPSEPESPFSSPASDSTAATPVGDEQKSLASSLPVAADATDSPHNQTMCDQRDSQQSVEQLIDQLRSITQRTREKLESQRATAVELLNGAASHALPDAKRPRQSSLGAVSIAADSHKLVELIETRLGVDIKFADVESDCEGPMGAPTPKAPRRALLNAAANWTDSSSASDSDALEDDDVEWNAAGAQRCHVPLRRRVRCRRAQMRELRRVLAGVQSRVLELDTTFTRLEDSLKAQGERHAPELRTQCITTAAERLYLLRHEAALWNKTRDLQLEDERERLELAHTMCRPAAGSAPNGSDEDRQVQQRLAELCEQRDQLTAQCDRHCVLERAEDQALQRALSTHIFNVNLEKLKADTVGRFALSFPLG